MARAENLRRFAALGTILWAKHRVAWHTLASARRESRLKVVVVSISVVVLWLGIFYLSRLGFNLLEDLGREALGAGGLSLSGLVMTRLLSVFALALFAMLTVSNVLIAFSTLYRSREVGYLLQSPISISTFFLGRFSECVTFSSWASAYLGSPVMLAYGLETSAEPIFYVALLAFYFPFITIPAALGAILTISAVRFFSKRRRGLTWALGGLALIVFLGLFSSKLSLPRFGETPSLQTVIAALGRVQSPFLPSTWAAEGVLSAAGAGTAEGRLSEDGSKSVTLFLLLLSNALFWVWVATVVAERWFYRGWTNLAGGGSARSRRGGLLAAVDTVLSPLPSTTRALVSKDIKLFWRDPAQWSQFVLLFGIMAFYVANLKPTPAFGGEDGWRGWGSLLNLGASMLILASLTTRFIYPLISLEGRRFGILGLAPVTMRHIVWQKFWLSVATTSVFTVGLAVLSALRLELDRTTFALSVAGIVATTLALSGLAVGLGSLYPNFREENPARIVSGLGGTLNFLLSMLYIALVGLAQAAVLLWSRLTKILGDDAYPWVVAGAAVWIVLLTAATCLVPLHLGLANLEREEL